ncbi:hypothetical protein [Halapricum desulfuricans]|uniref:Membrane-associated phospholipid phosphatase n=1 Tax=Halapricum desulfuricans TaxID=2841257 RepID=A0A897N811_9EURY|nr:hypothetical protein [Halapricum desulfuricans]QSG08408.1 Membrane-associated phospholipid phosphatase [Halapricum desulfuricans]
MSLGIVSVTVGAIATSGLFLTLVLCIDRPRQALQRLDEEILDIAPYLALVGVVMLLHRITHGLSLRISDALGLNITDIIYDVEGSFVVYLQAVTPDGLVPVFSGLYMFGFAYVLATPVVLYVLTSATRPAKELLVAYAFNNLTSSHDFSRGIPPWVIRVGLPRL